MSEMDNNVRYEILGAVHVHTGAGRVPMTIRERALLAALLLNVNEFVDRSRLVDAIWGERPPRDARNQLQGCVSRLRKRLAEAGAPAQPIVTHQAGYEIQVPPEHVDLWHFRRTVGKARAAVEQDDRFAAVASYRAALSIWRGPALAGVDSHLLRRAAVSLEEERVRAAEECIDLELAQGAAGQLVAELTDLVAQHPYRERLHAALMVALYRDGRRADALAAYQRLHRLMVDELGTEPGPSLRELHQRILREDQPISAANLEHWAATGRPRRCLPRSIGDFTGHEETVARIVEVATVPSDTPIIVAIDGMAGIGKTTVAVHVAHLLADRYPDAQLFIDLHGHSEHQPVEPAAALDSLLRQLGTAGGRIPIELDEREALWRSELAERRVLVVLDNAAGTAQVTPLVPAGPGCLVLITSRLRLTGLDSAHPLSLDQLPTSKAISLLAKVAGARVHEEPDSAAEVVRCCGYLPLAIRLAGTRLAHRTSWRTADLASRLLGARELLAELTAEDRTVVNAFALSYSNLPPDHQRFFRLLSLHPGDEFDECAAAALANVSLDNACQALEDLVNRHLVMEPAPDRFRLHDLVREFARQLVSTTEIEPERCSAVAQLLNFYLHATLKSVTSRDGRAMGRVSDPGEPGRPDLVKTAVGRTTTWLETERANLVALVGLAVAAGLDKRAWQLARAGWAFLYDLGYTDELFATHRLGLAAAERLGAHDATAMMCNYLASAHYKVGEFDSARALLERAVSINSSLGKRSEVATARTNLATVLRRLGPSLDAARLYEQSLQEQQELGDLRGMAITLQNLGLTYRDLGRYSDAIRCHRRRLAISRKLGDLAGLANPLGSLGALRTRLGQLEAARRLLTVSLGLQRRFGNKEGELVVGNDLGVLFRILGQRAAAIVRHREALDIAQEVGDRQSICAVRNDLGLTLYGMGDLSAAIEEYNVVIALATRLGLRHERARAFDGIAACLVRTEPKQARRYWELALMEYRETGVPEQVEVERKLAAL